MPVKNSYPEKQMLKFSVSTIPKEQVILTLKSLTAIKEVKCAAYVIMRNETGNFKSVIGGTNPSGTQSDSGRWGSIWDKFIVGTCVKNENMTGKERGFVVFDTLTNGINFLIDRVEAKGLFIGEHVNTRYFKGDVKTVQDLAVAYWQEWVVGEITKPNETFVEDFESMYKQAEAIF